MELALNLQLKGRSLLIRLNKKNMGSGRKSEWV